MLKLLVIANNCLSYYNSNGRTLLNMLGELPPDSLCQIYTSGEIADTECCSASLRLTNREVIWSYFGKKVTSQRGDNKSPNGIVKHANIKTALTMLLRDLAWDHNLGIQRTAIAWAKDQHPNAVLLQLGDSSLLINLALKITQALSIPLMTFNTEDYYFKQYDYMRRSLKAGIIYRIFHKRFCRYFRNMMREVQICIYNCIGLKELYDNEFGRRSVVIYGSTGIEPVEQVSETGLILYAGNLGLGRHNSLIEIGMALQQIDSSLHIDVYGIADEQVKKELEHAKGIDYHGVVSYDMVRQLICQSRLLVHVESFDEFISADTQYAFSTKLADCLASGVPTLLYGPITGAGIRYIRESSAAFAATSYAMLSKELRNALFSREERAAVHRHALMLASRNHDMRQNGKLLKEIIEKLLEKENGEK